MGADRVVIGAVIFSCTLIFSTTGYERNAYSLVDNRYGDLLIAISDKVSQDKRVNLIENIKETFSNFSRALFVATRRRAYLGNVTILVPASWNGNVNWEQSGTETFNRANVIVVKSRNSENYRINDPYVVQPGRCGEPGKYMRLSYKFLENLKYSTDFYSDIGKAILHEFGHLRWGLFDEYAVFQEGESDFYPSVDANGSSVHAVVKCSKMITGDKRVKGEKTWNKCGKDKTKMPENGCQFIPDINSTANSSLMFAYHLKSTTTFCDNDTSNPATLHNDEAPNKHNKLCQGRSQWEILRDHEDFSNNANPPIDDDVKMDTNPQFRIMQKGASRLVFVIDVSGSMAGSKIEHAKQTAIEAIEMYESDTNIGVVKFTSTASVVHYLVKMTKENRTLLTDAVKNLRAGGGTSIGSGIRKGINVLRNASSPRGGRLILLSDGLDNSDYLGSYLPVLKKEGIIVDTILVTDAADPRLRILASETGGTPFFSSDSATSTSLADAFTQTVAEESHKSTFVKLFGETLTIQPSDNYTQEIFIDDSLGKDTAFVLSWLKVQPRIQIDISRPSNTNLTIPTMQSSSNILRIPVPGIAETGTWTLVIRNDGLQPCKLQISITSRSKSVDAEPITLTCELGQPTLDFSDPNSSPALIIYATLTKGDLPVVDAKVSALVENSAGASSAVMLLDNGAGADTTKGDGIYSGYFINITGDGGYSVKVKVKDSSGKVKSSNAGQNLPDVCFLTGKCDSPRKLPTYTSVNKISRVATGGSFQVIGIGSTGTSLVDLYEPVQIIDLKVVSTFYENSTVTLQWTAVGDDLDQGTAARYDLRLDTSLKKLRENFTSSRPVNQSFILYGNISQPQLAGTMESFVINLTTLPKEVTYFFAVKAIDDVGKTSLISNIAPTAFTRRSVQQTTTMTIPTTKTAKQSLPLSTTQHKEVLSTPTTNGALSTEVMVLLILGSVIAVGVFVTAAFVFIRKHIKRKRTQESSKNESVAAHDNRAYEGIDFSQRQV